MKKRLSKNNKNIIQIKPFEFICLLFKKYKYAILNRIESKVLQKALMVIAIVLFTILILELTILFTLWIKMSMKRRTFLAIFNLIISIIYLLVLGNNIIDNICMKIIAKHK